MEKNQTVGNFRWGFFYSSLYYLMLNSTFPLIMKLDMEKCRCSGILVLFCFWVMRQGLVFFPILALPEN